MMMMMMMMSVLQTRQQSVSQSALIISKKAPGSFTAQWSKRKLLTWNSYVFPALNFWIRCCVSGVVKLWSSEVSCTSKYLTMYFSIMPFLHFSFHDNTVVPSSACFTDTSGIPGTVENKTNMHTRKRTQRWGLKEKRYGCCIIHILSSVPHVNNIRCPIPSKSIHIHVLYESRLKDRLYFTSTFN